jgi:hypothetical protein
MNSHLPYDVDSLGEWPWSFPASCSLASLSLPEDCGGRSFPSTGTIPILLFDDDADVLLGSDPASLPPQFDPANSTKTEDAGSNPVGYRVAHDSSSGVLGTVEPPAARASSEEHSSTRGGHVRNRFSGSHRLVFSPIGSGPSSGSADDHKGDNREGELSLFFDTDSPSCSRHCCSRPSSSRSSSLSCQSQASLLHTPGGQGMQQSCYGSCGASPAAISNTQLIAAAKHKQGFPLETFNPRIVQPFSNSTSFHDSVEQFRLPFTLNHNHDIGHQQHPVTYAVSSPASSSTEADLAIEFPPRDRAMGRDLPPPYSPAIEPSPSSSSSIDLPHHFAWLRNITISLCIDQEGFRAVFPTFKLVGYTRPSLPIHASRAEINKLLANSNTSGTSIKQLSELIDQDPDLAANLDAGMAEFMPLKRESFLFHHSTLDTSPSIRRLSVNEDESRDYLSQHASLSVKSNGGFQVYAVCGSEVRRGCGGEDTAGRSEGSAGSSPIKLEWRFEYAVEDKRKADGTKAGGGEKFLTPLRFSCSPWLLHSKQGRKVTVLSVWRKSIQPRLTAGKVEPPIITSSTNPGYQTHNLTGSASPPTSPKNVGALRFPTVTKLWGKWTKSSPYRFDKGSDGSEEDLIPSEDSANRRRRHRPSGFFSRVSQEAGRPLQRWDGDRSRSTDAIRPVGREARPAGGEWSRGRSKTQSLGRGTRSEGEEDRAPSRSQDGYSASRSVYRRRPRTAR